MLTLILLKDLFNKRTFKIVCKLKDNDKFKIFNLLNIDNTKNVFIDAKFARKICEKLQITFFFHFFIFFFIKCLQSKRL